MVSRPHPIVLDRHATGVDDAVKEARRVGEVMDLHGREVTGSASAIDPLMDLPSKSVPDHNPSEIRAHYFRDFSRAKSVLLECDVRFLSGFNCGSGEKLTCGKSNEIVSRLADL